MYPYDFVSALDSYKMGHHKYIFSFYNENTTHTHTHTHTKFLLRNIISCYLLTVSLNKARAEKKGENDTCGSSRQ